MKSVELHDRLNIELGKYLDLPNLGIKTTHKQYFLNKAIDIIFDEYYDAFERNEVTRFGLGTLINNTTLTDDDTTANSEHPNGITFQLPQGHYYTIKEYVLYDEKYIKVQPITYDYYNANINNIRRKPYSKMFWRLGIGDDDVNTKNVYREIIHDGSVIDQSLLEYHMTYISRPEKANFKNNTFVNLGHKPLQEAISRAVKLIYDYYGNRMNPQTEQVEQQQNQ